jgi:hypothetical protein
MTACWGQAESNAAPSGPGPSPGAASCAAETKRNIQPVLQHGYAPYRAPSRRRAGTVAARMDEPTVVFPGRALSLRFNPTGSLSVLNEDGVLSVDLA